MWISTGFEDKWKYETFVQDLDILGPLEPRQAFKLYEEASESQHIKYYDVTSLYPFVNKTGQIPLGHSSVSMNVWLNVKCCHLEDCIYLSRQWHVIENLCLVYVACVVNTISKVDVLTDTPSEHLVVHGSPMRSKKRFPRDTMSKKSCILATYLNTTRNKN